MSLKSWLGRPRIEIARILRGIARRINRVADSPVLGSPEVPAWVKEEAFALAFIEPELLTPDSRADHYQYYHVPNLDLPGELYGRLLQAIPAGEYTHIVLLPWLKQGGADRGAIYHIKELCERGAPTSVLVIATEPADSPWKDRLPLGVPYIEFGQMAKHIDFSDQVMVLTRLLVQMRPSVVHIINSRCGWESVRRSGLAIRQHTRLFASLFCDDHSKLGNPVGYARDYLRACYPHLQKVFCDNSVFPDIWSNELGVPRSLFEVVPFPYDRPVVRREGAEKTLDHPRVLWAGRLDRQKRPDLVLAIAERMPSVMFDIHGAAVIGSGEAAVSKLESLPNVVMHGFFARLEDVVQDSHIAYLHTTAWEGLPTILLDVAAMGVPICAPAVGGIPDFVERRWLIDDFEDVDAYVAQLTLLASSVEERNARRINQYETLEKGRAWSVFEERMSKMQGY